MTPETWHAPSPYSKYGLRDGAATAIDSPLHAIAGPGVADTLSDKPWSPHSPLFWFGALAAVTFGLMAVSVTGRAGPVKASVAVGKTS